MYHAQIPTGVGVVRLSQAKSYRVVGLSRSPFLTLHRPIGTFTMNRGPQVRGVVVDGWTPETALGQLLRRMQVRLHPNGSTAPDTKEVQAPPPEDFEDA